jgi:ArsR family transcriptional regulator, lead/cadmium/zinc/bismuth-responsive transcriptional repressor
VPAEAELCSAGEHRPHTRHFSTVELQAAALLFSAISDPGRLQILGILLSGEHCVGDLALELGDEMSTISQRLRTLRLHGLVQRRREGKHLLYSLKDAHVIEIIRSAVTHAAEPKA